MLILFDQLVVCAIPVFFKIPGTANFDLGSRTEGKVIKNNEYLLQLDLP